MLGGLDISLSRVDLDGRIRMNAYPTVGIADDLHFLRIDNHISKSAEQNPIRTSTAADKFWLLVKMDDQLSIKLLITIIFV